MLRGLIFLHAESGAAPHDQQGTILTYPHRPTLHFPLPGRCLEATPLIIIMGSSRDGRMLRDQS